MAWKYFKITSGGSSSTEFNPKEFNILAGTTQCQVGGTIESDRAPMWSTLATVIDGSLTTATYWPAGTKPTCIVTMPAAHSDLTTIEISHTFSHFTHSVWLSQDKIDWIVCPFLNSVGSTQNFGIPALPVTAQNYTANAELNIASLFDQGQSVKADNNEPLPNETSFEFSRALQNYVMVGHQDTLNIQSQMTMEFWIKLKPLPNDFQVILDKGNISTSQYYVIHEGRNGNNQIKYRFGNGPERTLNRPTSIVNNWTHMAFVHDGNVMEYYENGELVISESFPVTYSNNFEDLTFGKMSTSDGGYLDAFLDEIRIWKVARNSNEIKNNYNSLNVNPTNPDLLGYWKFNEGSGMYIEDVSPNFHNGYVFGDITFSAETPFTGEQGINFTANAAETISLNQSGDKIYTANGYSYNRWTLNYLDYYFYADQAYTPRGYAYEQTALEAQALTQDAAQEYTANGYERFGTDAQEIIFDFGAVQDYTPQGLNFEQSSQENIFVSYVGAQAFTAEGYDRATMAQENILLVSIAAQVYTANGYHSEATTGQLIPALTQEAAQEFAAHFENEAQENFNLTMQAAQEYAAHFENQAQLNFGLDFAASQSYTAIGYTREMSTSEDLDLTIVAAQEFAAHFEQTGTQFITLGMVASADYQANFTATATQNIFVSDASEQTYIRSDGLQFGTNSQDNINITFGAAQEFNPFGGYSFNQDSSNDIALTAAASLLYELGEIGKYSQRATLFLNLQESTQKAYTRKWLDFEASTAESMALSFGATSEHIEAHIFEANAAEVLTYFISPLQFYGQYLEGTDQENIGLSIDATSIYTNEFNEYDAKTLEPFYLHHTDKAIHEINYLSFNQSMYYDFWFWHFADSVHTVGSKNFTGQANEITGLTMAASVQYTNANMLNGFAAENINLTMAAHVEHIKATIYEFNNVATQDIHLDLLATCNHTIAQIYEFTHLANESIGLSFGAISEHIEAHIFDHEINENITLFYYGFSEYQNINPFSGKALEPIDFEHWATALNTTEPRDYEAVIELNIKLKIVNWIYFESDIYRPTYKIEIEKPVQIWEPAPEDRPDPYIFGRNPDNKIDRRILSLTDIGEPKKISYEKPNTLYTHKLELERGLVDD